MSFSYAQKATPFVLSPRSLDEHLAQGWYRMGASIFTTHFLFFNQRPYSAIWIRQALGTYRFSKRQRKLLRRNARYFEVTYGLSDIDAEKEALYERYSEDFDGRLSPSIADSLEEYGSDSIFNTREIVIREKQTGKLVALSYFDLGDSSAASILGIYDPLLKSFSLGFYTMLLEIQYCLERGLAYYYPGYIVPSYERFDYKLRLGDSEFFNLRSDSWEPFDWGVVHSFGPTEIQRASLKAVGEGLTERGIERKLLIYPLFEADLYDVWNDDYLPYPYLIHLGLDATKHSIVLVFDPRQCVYLIVQCAHMVQSQLLFNAGYLGNFTSGEFYTQLLSVQAILYRSDSPELVVDIIHRGLQQP